jgi:hypothetical protein
VKFVNKICGHGSLRLGSWKQAGSHLASYELAFGGFVLPDCED